MAKNKLWISLRDSARAAKPDYWWLSAYYAIAFISPLWLLIPFGDYQGFALAAFITSGVLFLASIIQLVIMFWKRRAAWLAMTLLSPIVVLPIAWSLLASFGYCTGSAQVQDLNVLGGCNVGYLFYVARFNIDPVTRSARNSDSYLNAVPLYLLTSVPYNATLFGLSRVFGPMPGAYRGVYPTDNQCILWLQQHADTLTLQQMHNSAIQIPRMNEPVDGNVLLNELANLPRDFAEVWAIDSTVEVSAYTPECLVVRYQTSRDWNVIALYAVKRQQVFARYAEFSETKSETSTSR